MGMRWCCDDIGKGKRNLNKFTGGLCINCWCGLGASGELKPGDWIAFDPLFIWVWIFERMSGGKLLFMILSLEIPAFAFWFSLLPLVVLPGFIANLADTRRFLKLLWWSILRESSLDDGKTFINGCFLVLLFSLELSVLCVKLATLDVIFADDIDDDDGGKCDGCKLFITLSSATLLENIVSGEGSCSGVGDRVRQFFIHNSGVIKCSTIE